MSRQDQIEQRKLADLYHDTNGTAVKRYKGPLSKRVKGFIEGYLTTRWAIRTGKAFWPFD